MLPHDFELFHENVHNPTSSHPNTTTAAISPALSAVLMSDINPPSRKSTTPTLPFEDSPVSSEIRKTYTTTSNTSSPHLDSKRARNTLAARKYRQKRVERLEKLERLLAEAERETERCRKEAIGWRMEAEKWRGRYEGLVVGGGGGGGQGESAGNEKVGGKQEICSLA